MTRGLLRAGAVLVLGLVLAACGRTVSPPTVLPTPAPTAALSAPASAGAPTGGPAASPGAAAGVAVDAKLLEILPATVDGLEVSENAEGEAAALGDPLLEKVGSAIAAGFAIDPPSGEFVYAIVVRLLPDALDETSFADFRATFDEGACSQADGVVRSAETEIGGRTVYIGTCAGGLRTYHVWLKDRGVLISASAIGERRLGELLVADLRP